MGSCPKVRGVVVRFMARSSLSRSIVTGRQLASLSVLLFSLRSASAASFNVTGADTAAKSLGAGETGVVAATGSLTLAGATVPITVTGSSNVSNSGNILQTGTGRGITNETGIVSLGITNGAGALIQTANGDAIRITPAASSVTLDNFGTITSLNGAKAGSQAIDWSNITTGSNVLTNYVNGLIQSTDADSVRPGVNGFVYNYGTIKSSVTTDTGTDGIDIQKNTGVSISNFSTGLIDSARHGITGGPSTDVIFTTTINNSLGGTIRGNNGSGINLDGLSGKQTATITNAGTITGNGATGDGDGIDVDGLVTINNSGTIRSLNAFSPPASGLAYSEGITVGGGTITNSGTIEGLVANGNSNAVGRGISLLGNDSLTILGTREAIYGNATVVNQAGGLIRGQTDSGIYVDGPASGFTVTITNNAGATIQGGGTANAAIKTGFDNDTVNNAGTIDGSSSGHAIDLGAGNDALNITGGSASVLGDISGGTGVNTLVIDAGVGNSFAYAGTISNFSTAEIRSGAVKLFGASLYLGTTTISGGTLFARNLVGSATGTGAVTVKNLGSLAGDGMVGGDVLVEAGGTIAPGDGTGTLLLGGNLSLNDTSRFLFDLGANAASSDLLLVAGSLDYVGSGVGSAVFDFSNHGVALGKYTLLTAGSLAGVDLSRFSIGAHDGFTGDLQLDGNSLSLVVTAIPEPSTTAALLGFMAFSGVIAVRARLRRSGPTGAPNN